MTAQDHLDGKFDKECPHTMESHLICRKWAQDALLNELKEMPLWVMSAFMKDDKFYVDEIRIRLMKTLISKTLQKAPKDTWDDFEGNHFDYTHYIIVFKRALWNALDVI